MRTRKTRRTISSLMAFVHGLEHVEALALILDDGVGLRVGAQADALPQIVHGVDVIHPVLVDHAQRHRRARARA